MKCQECSLHVALHHRFDQHHFWWIKSAICRSNWFRLPPWSRFVQIPLAAATFPPVAIRFGCVSLLWFWEDRNNNTLDTRFIGIHFRAELPESHARISASSCLQSGHCGHPNVDQQVLLPEAFEYIKHRWGISRKIKRIAELVKRIKEKVAQSRGGSEVRHVKRRGGYGAIHHSLHSFLFSLIQFTACVPSLRQWNTHVRQLCWSLALYSSAPILGHPANGFDFRRWIILQPSATANVKTLLTKSAKKSKPGDNSLCRSQQSQVRHAHQRKTKITSLRPESQDTM